MTLFGTDSIRGRASESPLDPTTLPLIGRAIAEQLQGRVLIGRDTRESGPGILDLLESGIEAGGGSVEDAGVLPTPAIALLSRESEVMGGIVISASHNPFKDNGIKVFGNDGRKLDDAEEAAIEARVEQLGSPASGRGPTATRPSPPGPMRPQEPDSRWKRRYLELLRTRFPDQKWMEGMHLTLDCANGAMSEVAPEFLRSIGAKVSLIHGTPDGTNINAACGAVHPDSLIREVVANGSDLSVAYDGDGDRAMFVSSTGRLVDGDAVLLVMSRILQRSRALVPPVVVGTSMTNYNLERILADEGVTLVRVGVGDRYIFGEMLTCGAHLGGEPSGHVIFSDYRLSGDGLLTTLKLCEALVSEGTSLDQLTRDWTPAS
jgi:phosphoglucosamine mutase